MYTSLIYKVCSPTFIRRIDIYMNLSFINALLPCLLKLTFYPTIFNQKFQLFPICLQRILTSKLLTLFHLSELRKFVLIMNSYWINLFLLSMYKNEANWIPVIFLSKIKYRQFCNAINIANVRSVIILCWEIPIADIHIQIRAFAKLSHFAVRLRTISFYYIDAL